MPTRIWNRPTLTRRWLTQRGDWRSVRRNWSSHEPPNSRGHEPVPGMDTVACAGRLASSPLVRSRRSHCVRRDDHRLGTDPWPRGLYARPGLWDCFGTDARWRAKCDSGRNAGSGRAFAFASRFQVVRGLLFDRGGLVLRPPRPLNVNDYEAVWESRGVR